MTALSAKEASYLFAVVAETCQRCFDYFVPVVVAAVGSVAFEVAHVDCTVVCHPGGQTGLLIGYLLSPGFLCFVCFLSFDFDFFLVLFLAVFSANALLQPYFLQGVLHIFSFRFDVGLQLRFKT